MFVGIGYLFLIANVCWSFYVSMFVRISVFSFSLQMCCGPFIGDGGKYMLFISLADVLWYFMGVCL